MFKHVLQFGVLSLLPMALLAVLLVGNLDRQATAQAIEEAKHDTREVVRAVIVPDLPAGLFTSDGNSIQAMDRIVHQRVLNERVVRVKIWSAEGTILYSDEHRLIGQTLPFDAADRRSLRTAAVIADLSDLSRPENRYERGYGQLLEVYLRVLTPGNPPMLFEDYIRYDAVTDRSARLLASVLPSMLGGLVLLELALLPLAWQLARCVRDGQRERQRLLQCAIAASEAERRRIAADLHDTTVQELAAVAYTLAGTSRQLAAAGQETAAEAVEDAARTTRGGVRQLRTLLVDIYPPSFYWQGLGAALRELLATAGEQGLHVELTIPPSPRMGNEAELLIFRAAREAVRNVLAHAAATHVEVSVEVAGSTAVLTVRDDGRGFDPTPNGPSGPDGHFGLRLLRDLARDAGGELDVASARGRGTTVRLTVSAV